MVVGRDVGFKEITFYIAFSVCVGNLFELFVRIFVIAVIERVQSQVFEAFIGNKFGVLSMVAGVMPIIWSPMIWIAPGDFLFNGFGGHGIDFIIVEKSVVFTPDFFDDVGEDDAMG